MSEYLHGATGEVRADGTRVADEGAGVIVFIGTAPVHTLAVGDAGYNVNKPVLVRNIAEARKAFGYSDDWASYTLCEAMHHFFETKGIGPLVLINVMDPAVHKASQKTTVSQTPANNRIVLVNAGGIILESLKVTAGSGDDAEEKEKGTDYTVSYNSAKETLTITGITDLGSSPLSISYDTAAPAAVTAETVIGATDNLGTNTGVWALKNVYQATGMIPSFVAVPGFSNVPAVHAALIQASQAINGHWQAYVFADLPILNGSTPLTMDTIAAWKASNGYNHENETVYFPLATGTDGKRYHLSVLASANFLELLADNEGMPYHSASNTDCELIQGLYLGEGSENKVYDDSIINQKLNRNGIASAAFVGGRWAIWGAHSANYGPDSGDEVNVAETNRMMLYYLCNDFQARRVRDVDQPLSRNDIASIVAEEQSRLDALVNAGVLLYGQAVLSADEIEGSDMMSGDYVFEFRVTTVPLAKSLRGIVTWVDDGFAVYYADADETA